MNWWRRLLQRDRVERQLDAELRDHFERLVADYVRSGPSDSEARRQRAAGVRRHGAGEGGLPRRARHALARRDRAGSALRPAHASPQSGLHARRGRLARARHRRQQRDLRARRRRPAEDRCRSASRSAWCCSTDGSWTNPIWEQTARPPAGVGRRRGRLVRHPLRSVARRRDRVRRGLWASGGFFDVLGVPAVLGRTFTPPTISAAADRTARSPSSATRSGSAASAAKADVIGRTLTLDRVPFTIVGVTPPSFLGRPPADRSTSRCRSARRRSSAVREAGSTRDRPGCSRSWRG